MSTKIIVLPLLFRKVTTLKGPTWYFDDGIYLDTIHDEEFGAVYRDGQEESKALVDAKTKCIYIEDPKFDAFETFAREIATKLKFVLNNFSKGTPMVLPHAFLFSSARKVRLIQDLDIENVGNPSSFRRQAFQTRDHLDRATISNYYKLVSEVCAHNPDTFFTLQRFNSCLTRTEAFDRIVDLTISLESLISGTQELRFKFALYHAFIATDTPEARQNAFEAFGHLYDARSGIVHGDVETKDKRKAFDRINEDWDKILQLSKASINYYLFYLFGKKKDTWDQHLKSLVFGRETRIVI